MHVAGNEAQASRLGVVESVSRSVESRHLAKGSRLFGQKRRESRWTVFPNSAFGSPNLTFAPRLFDWPRTSDEDIHESPGALLPVRTGRHVGDTDEGPK